MPKGKWDRKVFPPEVVEYIEEHSAEMKLFELRDALNEKFGKSYTYEQIKGYAVRNKIKFIRNVRHNIILTDEQAEYMISIIPGRQSDEVRDIMNQKYGLHLTSMQVRGWKKNHKTPSGYSTRYQCGNVPWIKGRKGVLQANGTAFEPGHDPHNAKPIGSLSFRRARNNRGYWMIKTSVDKEQKNYEMLHRYVWKQAHGEIPKGYKVVFRDGDVNNCNLENLMLVHEGATVIASTHFGLTEDPEINDAIYNASELRYKAYKLKKKKNEQG